MTSRPPIALVKRGDNIYVSGILIPRDGDEDSGLLRICFHRQEKPYQAFLGRLYYGPTGEGETSELAAQALLEKLQTETADFPGFLLALANGAEAEADLREGAEEDVSHLENDAIAFRILAGLAAQTRPVPAIGPDDFTEDDDAINFYADGEYGVTTVERLTLRIEARPFNEEDEDAEDLYDFTLRADGELHDGHSTLAEVARSYPDVSPSIEAWKAGRTVPFAVMLTAARKLAGLAEPLPEEAA